MKLEVELCRIFAAPELFKLLSAGEATVAQVGLLTRVLRHPRDRVLVDVAAARGGTSRQRVSELLAPFRGTAALLTVRSGRSRGYGQQGDLIQVLDAPHLPVHDRVFFMAMQATGRSADSANGWAARVFQEGTDAREKVPHILRRLTALGLLRQITDWSWGIALGLEGEMPERVDIGDLPEDHVANRPEEQEPAVAAKLNPLLTQAIQASSKEVASTSPTGLEAECVGAFRAHVTRGGVLSPDMLDEDLAKLLAGAAVDLQAAVRGKQDKLTPDVLQGARDVVAWERRVVLEDRDVAHDAHYLPLVRAGALQNFPQAMLTAVYAAAGRKNWRNFFQVRNFFVPGFDEAWAEIGIGTLMEVQAYADSIRHKDDYRQPALNSDQVFLPHDVHRVYCSRRGLDPQGLGLRAYAKGYEADVRSTQSSNAPMPVAPEVSAPAAALPVVQQRPRPQPAPTPSTDPNVQQRLRAAQMYYRGAWTGAMAVAGPAKFLNVVMGLRHSGAGRQSILSPEHCLIQYLEDLRNKWSGMGATFGEFLTQHGFWSEIPTFDAVWLPMVAEADVDGAIDRLTIESVFQKRIQDIRFDDLINMPLRGDKGFGVLTAWAGFSATASREEQAELRAKRVAAWVAIRDAEDAEVVVTCG